MNQKKKKKIAICLNRQSGVDYHYIIAEMTSEGLSTTQNITKKVDRVNVSNF